LRTRLPKLAIDLGAPEETSGAADDPPRSRRSVARD
jgi:hypothetical protein